ncbi:helix-turn-helix domain-containing protein [Algibacter sp. TI.3.09]|uniref:winged helix-turn-helix transcriptional regulator n=1 Tax=Algibacter sp. TI.3.09 TaxID=3121298 RepID=UPI00311DDD9A
MKIKNIVKDEICPVSTALSIIGGKWRLQIIFQIGMEKRRFGELKRLIPTISEKMLIQELKNLTQAGILNRKAYKEIPPKVEYSLTLEGQKILPIIDQIQDFGTELIEKRNNENS